MALNVDKASSRAFKPSSVTDNAEMFSARSDLSKMFTKLASGEKMKGMPF
jgi:hypothetical protein